jgi:hypothetical protein
LQRQFLVGKVTCEFLLHLCSFEIPLTLDLSDMVVLVLDQRLHRFALQLEIVAQTIKLFRSVLFVFALLQPQFLERRCHLSEHSKVLALESLFPFLVIAHCLSLHCFKCLSFARQFPFQFLLLKLHLGELLRDCRVYEVRMLMQHLSRLRKSEVQFFMALLNQLHFGVDHFLDGFYRARDRFQVL